MKKHPQGQKAEQTENTQQWKMNDNGYVLQSS